MPPSEHDLSVAGAIGSLKATAEATLRLVGELKDSFHTTTRDFEHRISALERARAWLLGAAAAVGFVAAKLAPHITA